METESERIGNKIVYTKYRRFLKNGHPYRALKHGWYKNIEDKEPPTRLTGSTLLEKLAHIKYVPGKITKNKKRVVDDIDLDDEHFVNENGDDERPAWYKKSIIFGLEYWSSHRVRHTIDVMHTEKNVSEHFINLLFDRYNQSSKFAFDKTYRMQCC